MIKRLSISLILVLIGLLAIMPSVPVLAIDSPDTIQLTAVYPFRHCLELNDRLFIVDFIVDYTTTPDETITEAFLVRFMDGTTELASVAPYASIYLDGGYGRTLAMIYFTADEAASLPVTWEGAYSVKLAGNPTLSWAGAIPTETLNTFNEWSSSTSIAITQQVLSARVLALAGVLEIAWDVPMVEATGAGNRLTSYAEGYFLNLVDDFRDMAPYAFSGQTITPDFTPLPRTDTQSAILEATTAGTPLDQSATATDWGTSEMFVKGLIWIAFTVGVVIVSSRALGAKPAMLMSLPMILAGALLGMLPLVLAIMVGVLAFLLTGYVLFYGKSGA